MPSTVRSVQRAGCMLTLFLKVSFRFHPVFLNSTFTFKLLPFKVQNPLTQVHLQSRSVECKKQDSARLQDTRAPQTLHIYNHVIVLPNSISINENTPYQQPRHHFKTPVQQKQGKTHLRRAHCCRKPNPGSADEFSFSKKFSDTWRENFIFLTVCVSTWI